MDCINNLDNFSKSMAKGLDGYFNLDGGAQSVSIEGLTCDELNSMYMSLADKMAIVSAESEGKQFIVDPLEEYRGQMDLIMSRMVNMGCPLVKSDKVFRSLPPIEPDMKTMTSTQVATINANPHTFQTNAYLRRGMHSGMDAVRNSVHTTAHKGQDVVGSVGKSIQKVGAAAITLVNDMLNGLLCGIGLTSLGDCKKDNAAGIRLAQDAEYSNAGGTMPAPCPWINSSSCKGTLAAYKCWEEKYIKYARGEAVGISIEDIVAAMNNLATWLNKNGCGRYTPVSIPVKGKTATTVMGGGVRGSINRVFPTSAPPVPAVAAKTSSPNRQRFSNAAGGESPCGCGGASSHSLKNTPCGCNEKKIGGRKSRADLFSNADGNGSPCGCKGKASGNDAPCPCKSGKPCPCQSGAPCGCQGKEKSMPNLIKPVNNHF